MPPDFVVAQHRAPADEAERLAGPGVAVVAAASEARALLQMISGRDNDRRSLARTRRHQAPVAEPADATPAEQIESASGWSLPPDHVGETDMKAVGSTDANWARDEQLSDGASSQGKDPPVTRDTSDDIQRLRDAAYREDRWILASRLYDHGILTDRRDRVRALGPDAAVVPLAAAAVAGFFGSVTLAVAIALVSVPLGVAAVLVTADLDRRIKTLDTEIDAVDKRIQSTDLKEQPDTENPETWSDVLAELRLPPMDHTLVERAVASVQERAQRRSRGAPSPAVGRRTGRLDSSTRPMATPVASVEAPGSHEVTVGHTSGARALDLVVVIDNGLYVGHRLALRDVSKKLAQRVPVLVLTTNERLWNGPKAG